MAYWYISSVGYANVAGWQASHAYGIGAVIKPTAGNNHCYVCIAAGTTGTVEPVFTPTKGYLVTDGAQFMEATGYPALNGDATNTLPWAASVVRLTGDIIKNVSGGADTYFICSTAGTSTSGSEPSWNKTTGATTTDGTATWTSLGAISGYTAIWVAPQGIVATAAAANWGNDGDTFFISNQHTEAPAGAVTVGGVAGYFVCVDDAAAPPTSVATTASFTASAALVAGGLYIYGINCSGATITLTGYIEQSNFSVSSSGSGVGIAINDTNRLGRTDLLDCTLAFGGTGQVIRVGQNCPGIFTMTGGSIAASGSAPNVLFDLDLDAMNSPQNISLRDVDLSGVTGTLFQNASTWNQDSIIYVENCRLGAGVTHVSGTLLSAVDANYHFHNCSSGSENYKLFTQNFMGSSQQETSIFRNGGASDGSTPVSWSLSSSANADYGYPFQSEEIAIWNDVVGTSLTATVEIAGGTALNTSDIWVEFEYLGNSGYPLGALATTKGSIIDTSTAVPSSSSSWNGSPASKQKLQAIFTPQMKGVVKARVYLAKPSTTVYVDPYIDLTNNIANRRQYLLPGFGGMNETAEGEFSYTFVA